MKKYHVLIMLVLVIVVYLSLNTSYGKKNEKFICKFISSSLSGGLNKYCRTDRNFQVIAKDQVGGISIGQMNHDAIICCIEK